MVNLTKRQISNRINWLDTHMAGFQAGYEKPELNVRLSREKMEEGLYPGLVFPVVSVLFGDGNEKLGKEFHKSIADNMEKASIANKFAIDKELKSYSKFSKTMIWFANEYMIEIFDSLDYDSRIFMKNKFKNIKK